MQMPSPTGCRALRVTLCTLTALLVLAGTAPRAAAAEPWDDTYAKLLTKYVNLRKGVDYAAWKANADDVAALKSVTDAIAKAGPSADDEKTRFAYYMNAYNSNVLRLVLEKYPVKSVADILPEFGFFKEKSITVDGKAMSLDELEKGILAKDFSDPRYHFAINCAAKSCPPLLPMPLKADILEDQLNDLAKVFITQNPQGVRYEDDAKQGTYSKIFTWYGDQFRAASPDKTIIGYLNQFRDDPIPSDVVFLDLPYNWNLNAAN